MKNNISVPEMLPRKRIRNFSEDVIANASQLTILCTLHHLTDFERKYVLLVYNEMLGGNSNSMLFSVVREKNSYAYYVNSSPKGYDNTLLIYAGIEKDNATKVLKLIRNTLQDISRGNFNDALLKSAKETLVASILASTDSPSGIINTYYASYLVHSDLFDERINKMNQVTKEDIIKMSKKVKLHTVYLLKGYNKEEYDENN